MRYPEIGISKNTLFYEEDDRMQLILSPHRPLRKMLPICIDEQVFYVLAWLAIESYNFPKQKLVSSASSSFSDFHSTPLRSFTCADHPCRNPDLQRAKNPPPETVSEIENSSLPTSLLTGPNQKMSLDGIMFFLAIFECFFFAEMGFCW